MRKFITVFLFCFTLVIMSPTFITFAYTTDEVVTPKPGGNNQNQSTENKEPVYPMYSVFTPKVTLLHNANALCAQDGTPIYYIPKLCELPMNLADYVASLPTKNYSSRFAYVYDGYFDTTATISDSGNIDDSPEKMYAYSAQNIETSYISNPTLKKIGYDLLLVSDKYNMDIVNSVDGNNSVKRVNVTNNAIAANDSNLQANVVIMDIYKALGVFEYELTLCFTKDSKFNANSSPILQELSVLTSSNANKGLDITESRTDVAVSRTNPELYWTRFEKDGVNRTSPRSNIAASQLTSMITPITSDTYITYTQFCNLTVALMNLYGEPALTDIELEACLRAYGVDMTNIKCDTKLEIDSVKYLVAKGILDPAELKNIDWDSPVRLLDVGDDIPENSNSIIDILGRIADVDIRLTIKEPEIIDSSLAAAGYSKATVAINPFINNYTEFPNDSKFYYDFLIEVTKSNTHIGSFANASIIKDDNTAPTTGTGSKKAGDENEEEKQEDSTNNETSSEEVSSANKTSTEEEENTSDKIVTDTSSNTEVNLSNDEYEAKSSMILLRKGNVLNSTLSGSGATTDPSKTTEISSIDGDTSVPVKSVSTLYDSNTNGYYYYGTVNIKGKEYYRFKVGTNFLHGVSELYLDYKKLNKDETLVVDCEPMKITNLDGGVYNIDKNGTVSRQSFTEAEFSEEFIDSSKSIYSPTASDLTTIIFYIRDDIKKKNLKKATDEDNINWSNMVNNNGNFKTTTNSSKPTVIELSKDTSFHAEAIISEGSANTDYHRVEIVTNDPDKIKNSSFFTGSFVAQDSYTTTGYYRSTDSDSLMVSFNYLKSLGLVEGCTEVSKDVYILTAGNYKTNVAILVDKDYVIVGDTMFPNMNGEKLIVKTNNETYINYRCCLGWAGDFSVISTDECVMAVSLSEFGLQSSDIEEKVVNISTFFPSESTSVLYNQVTYNSVVHKGISLAGSYALSPYILVMTEDDTDYLFVWHRNNITLSDGSDSITIKDNKDKKARETFESITGIKLDKQEDYKLRMYELPRNGKPGDLPKGFKYMAITKSDTISTRTATMGWLYEPELFQDCLTAFDAYAKGDLVMPIFAMDNKTTGLRSYYDANLNVCAASPGTDYLPLGTMPGYLYSSNAENKLYKITSTASYDTSTDASESTKAYPMYTAPVGLFSQLKGMGYKTAGDVNDATLYFGTSKCSVDNGKILLSYKETGFDTKSKAACTYLSTGTSTIFVVTENSTTLGNVLKKLKIDINFGTDDPDNLVDWERYKFDRLIKNLDAWSTVAMIFILNILPRIGIILFFVLLLLCLIQNVKPWRMFCERFFDLYKLLTLGHKDVNSINVKQVFILSIICIGLFSMIMDGQLFNFIIWVAKFFIAFYQR